MDKTIVARLFLAVPWGCLQFVIVVFPDHTHLLFYAIECRVVIFRQELVILTDLKPRVYI